MGSLARESFKFNLRTMRILGLYPTEKFQSLYRLATYVMYFLLIVPVPILQCMNLYVQEDLSFKQIADNTFLIAELGCFILKFWPFLNNGQRIKKCIHYFDDPLFEVVRDEHREIIKECIKVCRTTTALFLTCVTLGFSSWSSRPISWEGHIFPTDLWLPYDPKTGPGLYNSFVYMYLILAVGYGAYTSAAVDPLAGGLAFQASSQIEILKNNLQFLSEQVDEELTDNASPSMRSRLMYNKIRKCAIHYDRILQFVPEYEACFSQIAFSQFAGGVVVFCVSCLQLTIIDVLSFDFLAMIMYLIAMLSEVYLYCHFGTILFEQNNTVNDAIYLSKWYEYDPKCQQALLILMERAARPMRIVVGKIFDMSLITFTMILRRSYSLMAVLENYNIDLS